MDIDSNRMVRLFFLTTSKNFQKSNTFQTFFLTFLSEYLYSHFTWDFHQKKLQF